MECVETTLRHFYLMILIHFFFTSYIFSRYRVDYFIKTPTVNNMTLCEYKYEVNQIKLLCIYRVIQNDCRGFNNLS